MIPAEEPRWAWCFSKGAMPTICFDFYHLCIDNGQKFGIINFAVRSKKNMQWYRRGHNEHDWKSCCRQKRHEGSNPSHCAILTKRYRCVWRKARRINRFRAFSGPDFFFQTIDANRCFRASAPIRTGRFPFSGRCIQPAPFLNGDFSDWQRCFSQKRITKNWASFCWSCITWAARACAFYDTKVAAKTAYTSLRIVLVYECNANVVYFDGA